jgi:hypothetical protein
MASSSQPPTSPTSFPTSPQTYLLSIHLLKSILHTIHSTSLIPRQPTAPLRSSAASTVSFLSHPIVKIEELFKKRKCVRKRLKRWVTCRDRDYEAFVELKGEVSRVYEELVSGAG